MCFLFGWTIFYSIHLNEKKTCFFRLTTHQKIQKKRNDSIAHSQICTKRSDVMMMSMKNTNTYKQTHNKGYCGIHAVISIFNISKHSPQNPAAFVLSVCIADHKISIFPLFCAYLSPIHTHIQTPPTLKFYTCMHGSDYSILISIETTPFISTYTHTNTNTLKITIHFNGYFTSFWHELSTKAVI